MGILGVELSFSGFSIYNGSLEKRDLQKAFSWTKLRRSSHCACKSVLRSGLKDYTRKGKMYMGKWYQPTSYRTFGDLSYQLIKISCQMV